VCVRNIKLSETVAFLKKKTISNIYLRYSVNEAAYNIHKVIVRLLANKDTHLPTRHQHRSNSQMNETPFL
jgi:hypothetical protein